MSANIILYICLLYICLLRFELTRPAVGVSSLELFSDHYATVGVSRFHRHTSKISQLQRGVAVLEPSPSFNFKVNM